MLNQLLEILRTIRGVLVRFLRPKSSYWLATKSLKPLSRKFGFDRGKPIDRYWIEKFLSENERDIKGVCLEIGDNEYSLKFGGNKVTKIDVLDVDKNNHSANITGDLRDLKGIIKDNTYDCIILTHVLGLIDDYEAVIGETRRILKVGGVIILKPKEEYMTRDTINTTNIEILLFK